MEKKKSFLIIKGSSINILENALNLDHEEFCEKQPRPSIYIFEKKKCENF